MPLSGQDESRAKQLTAQLERSSAALAAAKQALADETTEARAAQVRPRRPCRAAGFLTETSACTLNPEFL